MSARILTARNPRTGMHDYPFTIHGAGEVAEEVTKARAAQGSWAALGISGRQSALEAFAAALSAREPALQAALETDTGRRRISRLEIQAVIAALRDWPRRAASLSSQEWRQGTSQPHLRHAPHWVPYPVVGVISPWNFPLLLSMIDAAPALAAGCAVVIKPSEITPRFVAPLLAAAAASGPVANVLRIITGDSATGAALVATADCVCFTGSVPTGRKVAVQAAERLTPAFLELGGKDPLLILEGADLAGAVAAALRGSVLATGQACQSIERIYVHRSLHARFVADLVGEASRVRLNWPDIGRGHIGPIISERQADVLREHVADAVSNGARVLCGGEIEIHGGGLWMRPTVLTGVTHAMKVMREETFGPIMPVMSFESVEEAIALANSGIYGLSAAVFARSLEEAATVARRLEAGAVSLNDAALTAVFHEAGKQSFKCSGLGPPRMGPDGFTRFLRRQALIANTAAPTPLAVYAEEPHGPPSS